MFEIRCSINECEFLNDDVCSKKFTIIDQEKPISTIKECLEIDGYDYENNFFKFIFNKSYSAKVLTKLVQDFFKIELLKGKIRFGFFKLKQNVFYTSFTDHFIIRIEDRTITFHVARDENYLTTLSQIKEFLQQHFTKDYVCISKYNKNDKLPFEQIEGVKVLVI